MNSAHTELQRQQWLLQTLHDPAAILHAPHWLASDSQGRMERGLQAYTDHADAAAERALAVSFPTVLALLGAQTFGQLARLFWRAAPPQQGDWALWGEGLADSIAHHPDLAEWPYLPDCARLDLAVAHAERAHDRVLDEASLYLLAQSDPDTLQLELMPGCTLVSSPYPIATIWQAHQPQTTSASPEPCLMSAREALQRGQGEHALVWRSGWRGQVQSVDAASACFVQAIQRGVSLARSLVLAGTAFAFDAWLVHTLQAQRLWRICAIEPGHAIARECK
jgi:hypothetical protein